MYAVASQRWLGLPSLLGVSLSPMSLGEDERDVKICGGIKFAKYIATG